MTEGIELSDLDRQKNVNQPEDAEAATSFIPPASDRICIRNQEDGKPITGRSLEAQRLDTLKTKVNVFLKAVAKNYGLLLAVPVYDEFVLGEDKRTLFLKDGLIRVTWKKDSTKYLALTSLESKVGVDFIRTHLFPRI